MNKITENEETIQSLKSENEKLKFEIEDLKAERMHLEFKLAVVKTKVSKYFSILLEDINDL
jgi:predicted RNase H-like nuclease (RuvC/YqgF family)